MVVATLGNRCLLSHVTSSEGYGAYIVNALVGSRRCTPSLKVHFKRRGTMIGRSAPFLIVTKLLEEEKYLRGI